MAKEHETRPVKVWVDVDIGIATIVERLNTFDGVRTDASCEGGDTYGPYVMAHWTPEGLKHIAREFDVKPEGNGYWGYVYPKINDSKGQKP